MYICILSKLLSFIPYFISRILSKRRSKKDSNCNHDNIYIYNKGIKKYRGKFLFKQILIVSLFGFFSEAVLYIFILINNNYESIKSYNLGIFLVLNTVVIYFVSYYVLKTYFYKHRFLSLFINSICFLVTLICDIITIVNLSIKEVSYYIYILIRIIRLILACFLFCYSKKVLDSAFLSPYSIIAFRSIYETIFLGCFTIPLAFINIKEYNNKEKIIFKSFLQYLKGINILYSILMLLADYLHDLFIMFIIYKFSPSHLTLAMIVKSFVRIGCNIIIAAIKNKHIYWSDCTSLGICLILFVGSMIHNEIFIINKYELNTKTQLYLNSEFNDEINSIEEGNNDLEEDTEAIEAKDKNEKLLLD